MYASYAGGQDDPDASSVSSFSSFFFSCFSDTRERPTIVQIILPDDEKFPTTTQVVSSIAIRCHHFEFQPCHQIIQERMRKMDAKNLTRNF